MKNLKIKYKFQIYPVLFIVIFIFSYLISKKYNNNNKVLLHQTKEVYLPNIELSIKLVTNLSEIQHALQNGVAMADDEFINNTDTLADNFIETCKMININEKNEIQVDLILFDFSAYHSLSKKVSLAMINNDFSEQLTEKISRMIEKYNELNNLLIEFENESKKTIEEHFVIIEKNNTRAANSLLFLVLGGTLVFLLISILISRNIVNPILRIVNYMNKMPNPEGTLTYSKKRKDEIGILSSTFASMMNEINTLTTNLEQKVDELNLMNNELIISEEEIRATNEELSTSADALVENESILLKQNSELEIALEQAKRSKALEKALNKLKETQVKLVQSEKMASLGILTAGVAHEINNPLNYIMGGYWGLKDYFEESSNNDENVALLLNSINEGVIRAADIVKSLNQFSRTVESNNEDCNITDIVKNCLIMVNNQLTDKITVVNKISESYIIIGNVGKLHQVFINLLINSIQALEDSGEITIDAYLKEKNIEILIKDTGYGISEENLSQIADPFFTTKEPGQGTGLGLSIVYSIIKEHNGVISYNSEKNKGTTVTVILPIKN